MLSSRRPYGPERGHMASQQGWGLLAAAGAVLFVSLVIAGQYSREMGDAEKKQVDLTRDVIVSTAEVLYQFRLENANTWPAAMSDLVPYAPVLAANARNGVGQPLTLVPPSPANHPTAPIVIRTDLLTSGLAERVRSEFPGQEPPVRVQELLVRDGTRDMTGDLDMGGHDIEDVGSFLINRRLIIGGQVLDADRARFLVQMAGLNCGPDRLLNIAGRQATCIDWVPADSLPPPILPPALPGVSVSGGGAVTEGQPAVFVLVPTVPFASPVTVVLQVTDRGDFVESTHEGRKTVTFPAGDATVTWSVPTVDDGIAEPSAHVAVRVEDGTGYVPYTPRADSVEVNDNDGPISPEPVITVAGGNFVTEGGTAVFTIRADRTSTADIPVRLNVSDDASGDFLASSREGRKSVTLPAGTRTATYSVPTENDTVDEPHGRVTVDLVRSGDYTVGSPASAHVVVHDDDRGTRVPEITVTARPGAITEGGAAVFTVRADRASTAAINISLDVSDDATSDFLAPSAEGRKSVTLPAGARSATYSVRTEDDSADEPNGQVSARIVSGTGYTTGSASSASVTVRDNDLPPLGIPEINISAGGAVTEGGDAIFTLRASRAPAAAISIGLNVADDASADFLAASDEGRKTVTLPARHSHVRYTVPTEDDTVDEPDGRVTARVVTGTGYTIGSRSSASVTVRDDDAAPPAIPVITITGGSPVTEGGTAVFTIQADRVPAANISIGLDVSDDATSDFLAPSSEGRKSVSLARGSRVATHSVRTVNDTVDEPDGRVSSRIVSGTGYTVGSRSSASVTVRDDDPAVPGCANPRPADLHPDADWDCDTGEPKCGPVRVRNVLTVINDQTTGRSWYQLTDISAASDCPVVNLGIGGNRRWKTRCDPDARTGDWLRACGPWQSQIYRTSEGACGVEYCLATPLSFNLVRGRGHLASTAGSLECPDPGSTTFGGIDFTSYRCRYIQPGVNNNWRPR